MVRRLALTWLWLVAVIFLASQSFAQLTLTGAGKKAAGGGGGGGCTASTNFLARTSLAGADITNYQNLICGLVTDGIITGNLSGATGCGTKLDFLYILATVNTTEALKNLCGTSYSLTVTGSPTFTAYQGYAGSDGSGSTFLNTNFNPNTAGGVFSVNSCHVMAWSNTNTISGGSGGTMLGTSNGAVRTQIAPYYTDTNGYFSCNNGNYSAVSVANGTALGMQTVSRTGASVLNAIRNSATSMYSGSDAAAATLDSQNIYVLATDAGGGSSGDANQLSVASAGAGLSSGDISLLFGRLATYRTAVGL